MRRWNGLVRYSQGTATNGFSVTASAYDADWNSSDQIPRRAVDDGALVALRLSSIGPTAARPTASAAMAEWQRTTDAGITHVEGYAFDYGLDLFSNFTYFLDDPEHGDQFEQRDDRVRLRRPRQPRLASTRLFGRRSLVTFGSELRRDDIGAVGPLPDGRARAARRRCARTPCGQTSGAGLRRAADAVVGRAAHDHRRCAATSTAGTSTPSDPVNGGTKTDAHRQSQAQRRVRAVAAHRALRQRGRRLPQQRRPRRHDSRAIR